MNQLMIYEDLKVFFYLEKLKNIFEILIDFVRNINYNKFVRKELLG